jgi:hypothetical protein
VAPTTTLGELHDACKRADDGMLYVTYTAEAAMGTDSNLGLCGMPLIMWGFPYLMRKLQCFAAITHR